MGSRGGLAVVGFGALVAFGLATVALSAPQGKPAPVGSASASASAAASSPPAVPRRSVSAIADIATELDAALPPIEGRVLVGVAPLSTDVTAPRAKALATTIASVVAGKRGFEPASEPESLDTFRGRAEKVQAVVYLTPSIVKGELVVTADAYPVPKTVWSQIKNPRPGPFAHAFAKAPIDAEVRSHLEPVPLTALESTAGSNFENGVVALACDDLDRDGAPEIVSMSRRSITLLRIRSGKVEPIVSHNWTDLAPLSPTPIREAIGFLAVTHGPTLESRDVVAGITDRSLSIRLDARLGTVETFKGIAEPDGDAFSCARLSPALSVTGHLDPCSASSPMPTRSSMGGQYDAFASAQLVTADGKPYAVFAGREAGTLELFDDANHIVKLAHVGAQIAVGDIDQDGEPEILTSTDVIFPEPDAIVVHTWHRAERKLTEVMRLPVAAGVHALAICPPETGKRSPFVVATIDDIVVLR